MSEKVKNWHKLNKRHFRIARKLDNIAGGPDITPEHLAEMPAARRGLVLALQTELFDVFERKLDIESSMGKEEFDEVYPDEETEYYLAQTGFDSRESVQAEHKARTDDYNDR